MHHRLARFFILSFSVATFLACSKFVDANAGETTRASSINAKGEGTLDFKKAGISVGIKFAAFPPVVEEETEFQLRFWNTKTGSSDKGPFIDPGFALKHPDIRLWMPPPMNHGSAKFKFEKILDDGDVFFKVTNVLFTMPGVWEIQFKVKNGQGAVVDEAKILYDLK